MPGIGVIGIGSKIEYRLGSSRDATRSFAAQRKVVRSDSVSVSCKLAATEYTEMVTVGHHIQHPDTISQNSRIIILRMNRPRIGHREIGSLQCHAIHRQETLFTLLEHNV